MPDMEDKVLLLDYTKRFVNIEHNYWVIPHFCTIADMLSKLGKPNIDMVFLPET